MAANSTTQRKLCGAIWRMLHLQGALLPALTFWQIFLLLLGDILAALLQLVTSGAEMCCAPAEPLCNVAAELALVLDEFGAMGGAGFEILVGHTSPTDEVCRVELVCVVVFIFCKVLAILEAAKVWLPALETLVIAQLLCCVLNCLAIPLTVLVCDCCTFVQALVHHAEADLQGWIRHDRGI